MEITSKFKDRDNSSPLNSPTSCSNSTNNTTTNNNSPSPLPITRSDPNSPYPTTFVTADTTSFKQVVQMLTGSSEITSNNNNNNKNHPKQQQHHHENTLPKTFVIPPIKTTPKKQGFKLYERRNSIKNLISPLTYSSAAAAAAHNNNNNNMNNNNNGFSVLYSPRHQPEILSPSLLDFPSLTLSPVTPLVEDPFDKSSPSIGGGTGNGNGNGNGSSSSSSEEEKAIAEKGYYFHPSPISTPRDSQPQLLPLFPLSSPR